jgi:hypothetical protein
MADAEEQEGDREGSEAAGTGGPGDGDGQSQVAHSGEHLIDNIPAHNAKRPIEGDSHPTVPLPTKKE